MCVLDPVLLVTLQVSPFLDLPRVYICGIRYLRRAPVPAGLPFQVIDHPGAHICGIADQLVKDLDGLKIVGRGHRGHAITGSPEEGIAERDGMT